MLWWIYGVMKQFKQFVQNRVTQIRNFESKEQWQYCPTELNPSDLLSRGIKCSEIASSSLWWKGPPFLEQSRENWPNQLSCPKNSEDIPEEARQELRKSEINTLSTQQVNTYQPRPSVNTVIPCENYSSPTRLLKVTALVQRFIKLVKVGLKDPQMQPELSSEDLKSAKAL